MSVADGCVLVPIVAVILALALYPQLVLERTEESVAPRAAAQTPTERPREPPMIPLAS